MIYLALVRHLLDGRKLSFKPNNEISTFKVSINCECGPNTGRLLLFKSVILINVEAVKSKN